MPSFPAVVCRTCSWPDNLNAVVGPFESANANTVVAPWAERGGTDLSFGTGSGAEYLAQSFTPPVGGTVSTFYLGLKKVGAPADNYVVEVQSDAAGAPSGTVLYTVSVAGSGLSASSVWTTVALAATLDPGVPVWLVLHRSGASDAVNYYAWARNASYDRASSAVGSRSTRNYASSWVATGAAAGESLSFRAANTAVNMTLMHAPLVDNVRNVVQMHRSIDGGLSWHHVDVAGSPPVVATAGERCLAAFHYATNSQIYAARAVAAGGYAVRAFSPITATWSSTESFSTGTRGTNVVGVGAVFIGQVAGNANIFVTYQGAPENVAGTDYRRVMTTKGPTTGTYDVVNGSATLSGTAVHHDLRSWLQASSQNQAAWTQSDDAFLHHRYWTSVGATLTWKTKNALAASLDPSQAYPVGYAAIAPFSNTLYVPYVDGTTIKVAKAVSATAEVLANWSYETVYPNEAGEQADAVPVACSAETLGTTSTLVYAFRVRAGSARTIDWTNNRSTTAWMNPAQPWRAMADVVVGGIGLRALPSRMALLFEDLAAAGGPTVCYDELPVFVSSGLYTPGAYTKIYDLKRDTSSEEDPFTIRIDGAQGAGAATVTAYTGDSPDPVVERGTIAVDGTSQDSYGDIVIGDVQRYVKVVATVTATTTYYLSVIGY